MIIRTVQILTSIDMLKYEDKTVKTQCLQQSEILADNDRYEFLEPMADYIAHLIIKEEN